MYIRGDSDQFHLSESGLGLYNGDRSHALGFRGWLQDGHKTFPPDFDGSSTGTKISGIFLNCSDTLLPDDGVPERTSDLLVYSPAIYFHLSPHAAIFSPAGEYLQTTAIQPSLLPFLPGHTIIHLRLHCMSCLPKIFIGLSFHISRVAGPYPPFLPMRQYELVSIGLVTIFGIFIAFRLIDD